MQSRNDDFAFFRAAYYWRFGKDTDTYNDTLQYRMYAVVPKYVQEYVQHLQQQPQQPT